MSLEFEFARYEYQSQEMIDDASLRRWEEETGWRLPADYREFILLINGGILRPYRFIAQVNAPPVFDRGHILELMFDWEACVYESQFDIEPGLRNTPPEFLAIGETISGLYLMLALAPARHGSVWLWTKDLFNTWGEGPNSTVTPVAPTFNAFLRLLHHRWPPYHEAWKWLEQEGHKVRRIRF